MARSSREKPPLRLLQGVSAAEARRLDDKQKTDTSVVETRGLEAARQTVEKVASPEAIAYKVTQEAS